MEGPETVITICMGSSCFSRGNNISVEIIQKYLEERGIERRVELRGCLCGGNCKNGPNLTIDGESIAGVRPEMITDLLGHKLLGGRA